MRKRLPRRSSYEEMESAVAQRNESEEVETRAHTRALQRQDEAATPRYAREAPLHAAGSARGESTAFELKRRDTAMPRETSAYSAARVLI